jgi:multiple sugar transport system permease protein
MIVATIGILCKPKVANRQAQAHIMSPQHQPSASQLGLGLAFVSPWLFGFALLVVFPFTCSLWWSFCRYDLLSPPQFVGLEHYNRLGQEIAAGTGFGKALWNTSYYAIVHVPLSIMLGIGLASILSWRVRGQSVYRTLCFLPTIIPVVASSVLWIWLLDPTRGIVNHSLGLLGLPGPLWLNEPREAFSLLGWLHGSAAVGSKDALVLMSLWSVGNFMLIYLAAIADIPDEMHEAAAIDGASRWSRFCHITLPMLTPVILFNLVMGLIQSVQAFTQLYIVSEGTGAPQQSLLVLSLHLFLSAFQDLDMGYTSAMAWIVFVVLVVVTGLLFRFSRGWVHYASQPS